MWFVSPTSLPLGAVLFRVEWSRCLVGELQLSHTCLDNSCSLGFILHWCNFSMFSCNCFCGHNIFSHKCNFHQSRTSADSKLLTFCINLLFCGSIYTQMLISTQPIWFMGRAPTVLLHINWARCSPSCRRGVTGFACPLCLFCFIGTILSTLCSCTQVLCFNYRVIC
mgnify:CR=1 FL=1